MDRPEVLLVEDDSAMRQMLTLSLPGVNFREAADPDAAWAQLDPLPDVVLTDVHLGGRSGIDLARELRQRHPRLPVVVMTAFGDLSLAIEALRAGAWDFLTKPVDLDVLESALQRAAELHHLRREVRQLRRAARSMQPFGDLVGDSAPMRQLFSLLAQVAPVPSSVLIRGETGTGKELVARALHDTSPRRDQSFVAINCAAVPEGLLEGELFGHVKGAFTDAHADRVGLVVQAAGGTLFLDEIGDMPSAVQAKLLRVLQDRRVRPVGGTKDVEVDVRVVAATHKDLDQLVDDGAFREDLLYRLDVIRIEIPPLRERGTDVLLLAQRFVRQLAQRLDRPVTGIAPEVAAKLADYPWPGNVRELQNCIERAVVLCQHDELQLADLPPKVAQAKPRPANRAATPVPLLSLHEVERRHILAVMDAVGHARGRAAEILGIDRKTLYRKLSSYPEG